MFQDIPNQVFYFLGTLWFIAVFRSNLFYIYLWQLKEYHIGRFLAHFSTQKGRSLLLNPLIIFKVFLLLVFPFFSPLFYLPLLTFFGVLAIYFLGFPRILFDFVANRVKRPVLTKKAVLLILLVAGFQAAFLFVIFENLRYFNGFSVFLNSNDVVVFSFLILLFDVLTPLIASAIVLLFQPFAVLMRNRIINKARQKREKFRDLLVIGITGSYGKTSTKDFLYSILADKFSAGQVLKTSEHQNSEVGISRCILDGLNENHKIFVVEMGAYNMGGIRLLCKIAKPRIGVLTGINEQHMATFGSQENIMKAKYELIENLPKDGLAFFNAKNEYCVGLYNETLRRGSVQTFLYGQGAKFFGEENILGAMAVARELGMTEEEIKRAADKIQNKMPGVRPKKGIGGVNVVDSTYSANPDGVIANLEYLRNNFSGRKIIVMPCLIELGKASRDVHKKIGKKIAETCNLAVITTSDRFREIIKGAAAAEVLPSQKCEFVFLENPKRIFNKIKEFLEEEPSAEVLVRNDVVLLESRVPKKLIKMLET